MNSLDVDDLQKRSSAVIFHHVTLVVGLVCVGIGQTLLYTILGPASREIGMSEFNVGMIVTLAALVITLSSGGWGWLIRRFGSRNAYLAGMFFYTGGTLLLGFALQISINHLISVPFAFILLLTVRCITGALTAGIHPSAMTYIAESTTRQERGAGMALIASAYGIGSVIGPLLGSAIGSISLLLPIYIAAFISFVGLVLGFFILKNKVSQKEKQLSKGKSLKISDKRVLPVFFGIACTYISFSSYQQTISFYIQDKFRLEPHQAVIDTGIAVSIMALCMIVVQLGYIQYFKPSFKKLLSFGVIFCTIGFIFLIMTNSFLVTYIASGFLGTGFGMMIPSIQSSASLAVTEDEQSEVAGFLFGASAFGYVLGPATGTFLYGFSPVLMFAFCISSVLLAGISTWKVINKN